MDLRKERGILSYSLMMSTCRLRRHLARNLLLSYCVSALIKEDGMIWTQRNGRICKILPSRSQCYLVVRR